MFFNRMQMYIGAALLGMLELGVVLVRSFAH